MMGTKTTAKQTSSGRRPVVHVLCAYPYRQQLKSTQSLDDGQRALDLLEKVPDILRESHTNPRAEGEKNSLNPENGLSLSATYDTAFDRHPIPFDGHNLLIASKAIKDHYTDAVAKSYFLDPEGQIMSQPTKFLPSQTLLEKHKGLLAG